MIVDIFTHFMPLPMMEAIASKSGRVGLSKKVKSMTELGDLDARLRAMDAFPDYRQVISLGSPPIETITTPEQARGLARASNDALAELVRRHPTRFPAFVAGLPFHDMDSTLAEAERAIKTLGARGVQIYTNVNGRPLDDPQFEPLFAAMEKYDLPVWLHPARSAAMPDYTSERLSRFEMWWCFGWPYETSVAMSRLVLSGLFDRHPKLKIITHHLGGMIPFFDKRIEDGLGLPLLGTRTQTEDYSGILPSLKRPLIDYFHMFYADTALFGASHGLACGLDFFGADHVVFASDAPFGPVASTRDGVNALAPEKAQFEAIFHRNAEKLLNLRIA
jgi:uncharacterized protein